MDFAALSEPGNCREYVAVHHRLGVDAGDRLLDVACGSGLAIELARLRRRRSAHFVLVRWCRSVPERHLTRGCARVI